MNLSGYRGKQRWVFGSIAIYVDDHALAMQVAEAVTRNAAGVERMGICQLHNGDRVAWVRFDSSDVDYAKKP